MRATKKQIKAQIVVVRTMAAKTNLFIEMGDTLNAYQAAEATQHAAFDLKDMIAKEFKGLDQAIRRSDIDQ